MYFQYKRQHICIEDANISGGFSKIYLHSSKKTISDGDQYIFNIEKRQKRGLKSNTGQSVRQSKILL